MKASELTRQDIPVGDKIFICLTSEFPVMEWEGENVRAERYPQYTVIYQRRTYIQSRKKFVGKPMWLMMSEGETSTSLRRLILLCLERNIIRGGIKIITDIKKLPPGLHPRGLAPLTKEDKDKLSKAVAGIVVK